jgi:hypothetical protein
MSGHQGIWREPDEESVDLYPGLVVHDGRVSGSITTGRSRLPLWAFMYCAIRDGWEEAERDYEPSQYGWDAEKAASFIYELMELRGEFARLLLVLAAAERWDRETEGDGDEGPVFPAWWVDSPEIRERVKDQLRRCLACLEA